jgi:hypothetical protein
MEHKIIKVQVTGGRDKWPVYDMNGLPIYVGDTLEYQYCSGPYGQTMIARGKVVSPDATYCAVLVDGPGSIHCDLEDGRLYCRRTHHDFEHGHKTWARVINS